MQHDAPRFAFLSPLRVRSFRFQWPADLMTCWAQEMETLILNWYVLTATGSVVMLTLFASLQYLGTLLSPVVGSIADILGRRTVLCGLRAAYCLLAAVLMVAGMTDRLAPELVFGVAFLTGLIRPSDLVVRQSMLGDTMEPQMLGSALGLSRLTMDTARIAGALAGAGLFATVGLGAAYVGVVAFYGASFLLTLGTSGVRIYRGDGPFRLVREVKDGLLFSWRIPRVKSLMLIAFLVNLCAFPITMGILPFAAKEVFGVDETGLGKMLAMFGVGALVGSVVIALTGGPRQRGRRIIAYTLIWFLLLLVFGQASEPWQGYVLLGLIGYAQGIVMLTMAIALMEAAGPVMRGRVMGVRVLAVYGLPVGLAAGGKLVELVGYHGMVTLYCILGIVMTIAIAAIWREALLAREDT